MNAIWCKALAFDLCITSSISRISFSSLNMTTSSCSSCSPETLSLRARIDVNGREDALLHAAQDLPFVDAQLRRALRQIKHDQVLQSTPGSGTGTDARLPCARTRQSAIHAGNKQASWTAKTVVTGNDITQYKTKLVPSCHLKTLQLEI